MRRYVDADKLPRHGKRGGIVYWRDIESQSTTDVRENVHGEWLYDSDYVEWSCSKCGIVVEDELEKPSYRFCPWCGADMRGEQDE